MRKLKIILKILTIILVFILIFFSLKSSVKGQTNQTNVKNYYTYTKAVCNESNFCQDYYVVCENQKIKNISPITGAFIQHSKNWKDPRDEESKKISC